MGCNGVDVLCGLCACVPCVGVSIRSDSDPMSVSGSGSGSSELHKIGFNPYVSTLCPVVLCPYSRTSEVRVSVYLFREHNATRRAAPPQTTIKREEFEEMCKDPSIRGCLEHQAPPNNERQVSHPTFVVRHDIVPS